MEEIERVACYEKIVEHADILGPFASIGHVSDCFISFAATLACVAAVFISHSGGDWEGLTG